MSDRRDIRRILVANRGEIAVRVMRTAREMGIGTVAVYSEPDRTALHVRHADAAVALGGTTSSESYLDIDKVLDAATRAGADAVHPGYGFLSENADFAEACLTRGLVWIGPSPEAVRSMGDKVTAKDIAARAGVPVLPSVTVRDDDPEAWQRGGDAVGYPLLVKASAGGGGKGMRRVDDAGSLTEAVTTARREAASSFGDPTVFLERLVERPRHVEVQVLGDEHGHVVHLFERDCSLQRRHQKVIEEAPAPGLATDLRARLLDAGVSLAEAIGYVGVGTVEFLVADDDFFFLEMNTRLQVEHPVTEAIVGLDLVRLQIQVAQGEALPFGQADVVARGHAVEARLYAEDPADNFAPSAGELVRFRPPSSPAVRWDSGVETGATVTPYYDPMLAKVIAHGATRREATGRLAAALRGLEVHGVRTNRDLLVASLEHVAFGDGAVHTAFFDDHDELQAAGPPPEVARLHAVAVALVVEHRRRSSPIVAIAGENWRNITRPQLGERLVADRGEAFEVLVRRRRATEILVDGEPFECVVIAVDDDGAELEAAGLRHHVRVGVGDERGWASGGGWQTAFTREPRFTDHERGAGHQGPVAPLPGTIVAVEVATGDQVAAGDTLVVLEAMKMEHRIVADVDGAVDQVLVRVGDRVDAHQPLVVLAPAPEGP